MKPMELLVLLSLIYMAWVMGKYHANYGHTWWSWMIVIPILVLYMIAVLVIIYG